MLKIDAKMDLADYDRSTEEFLWDDLLPALVDALNEVAELACGRLVEAQASLLYNPTEFTQNAWRVLEDNPIPGRDPSAWVVARPIQAQYLEYVIDGGVRRAGDYATTRYGPLVPGRDADLDVPGNLPQGYVSRMLRDPDVAWVTLNDGETRALIRHAPGRDTEFLAFVVRESHQDAKLPLVDIVSDVVDVELPGAVAIRLG